MNSTAVLADPSVLVPDVVELRLRLEAVLDDLTDAQVAAPSPLPGWTVGHVLAHVSGVGASVARQIEHARAGRLVAFYDGGMPARDAAIEAAAGAPAEDHARDVRAAALRVESAFAALGTDGWGAPIQHRSGTVLTVAHAWWRELGIHLTDLELGVTNAVWSPALCEHLVRYLAPRVPEGTRLVLRPTDGPDGADGADVPTGDAAGWELGAGEEVTVHGAVGDLVAVLAGREPVGTVETRRDGVPAALPELLPWP
ncbi:MAG: maleylpyruvate isomerase family mycothiol-dependent enzyme [Cellulomonas sp.]